MYGPGTPTKTKLRQAGDHDKLKHTWFDEWRVKLIVGLPDVGTRRLNDGVSRTRWRRSRDLLIGTRRSRLGHNTAVGRHGGGQQGRRGVLAWSESQKT